MDMTVNQLINKLEKLPKDKQVFCQVVSENGEAWNMFFDIHDLPNTSMVQLEVSHPDLKKMPKIKD